MSNLIKTMQCPKCASYNVELKDFYEDGELTEQLYECKDCEETGDKYDFSGYYNKID